MLLWSCVAPFEVSIAGPSPDSGAAATEPLRLQEVLGLVRERWRASYDLQVVQRRDRLYLQMMWGYLEQQSFPLDAEAYEAKIQTLIDVLNGLGVAEQVRHWLRTSPDKPRLGRAMSLALEPAVGGRTSEFLL